MGAKSRPVPERLAWKLKAIRLYLGLTQTRMAERIEQRLRDEKLQEVRVYQNAISMYEAGEREPPLVVILAYALLAGIGMDYLAHDRRPLPPAHMLPLENQEYEEYLKNPAKGAYADDMRRIQQQADEEVRRRMKEAQQPMPKKNSGRRKRK